MKDIKISQATLEDRPQLVKFFKHYQDQELIENRLNFHAANKSTIIAKDQDKLVGIIQWLVKEDPRAGVAELEELFVLEEYRGIGVGAELIKHVLRIIKDYFEERNIKSRKVYLFVAKENVATQKLYEKFGFKYLAMMPNIFSDDRMEFVYCLDL